MFTDAGTTLSEIRDSAGSDPQPDSLNILSRNVAARGRDNRWRRTIGDERKLIGDFACAWAALLGIEGR